MRPARDEWRCLAGAVPTGTAAEVVGVKDNIDVRGLPTTNGTSWHTRTAGCDARVVAAARRRGDPVFVKTTMDELALGAYGVSPAYGDVVNPAAPGRMTGGSSGGSAAAVASGLCDWALGTDTGGSVRIPASLCGIVGVKPTLGSLPIDGLRVVSPTLDTVGVLAPDVAAARRALHAVGGLESDRSAATPITRYRLGRPADWIVGLDAATAATWRDVATMTVPAVLPPREVLLQSQRRISRFEAWRTHEAVVTARPDLFGPDATEYFADARTVGRADYESALAAMRLARAQADDVFADLDAVLLPSTASVAPPAGARGPGVLERLLRFVKPFNTLGWPVVCLPGPSSGLPVGVQVVCRPDADRLALDIAQALESHWRDEGT